jgi:heterodisulfide reductase subunit B
LKKVGKGYDGKTSVKHFAQVLYENLELVKEKVVNPLEGFKVAVHYGCHYLRPSEFIQWDDPFNPYTIDEIVRALGAESLDYENKIECCGNPVDKSDKDLSLLMIENKLEAIKKSGANCIALVCPACYQQFDFNQRELSKKEGVDFQIPIFYLSELAALAFGHKQEELGLNFHRVRPKGLLEKIGFPS